MSRCRPRTPTCTSRAEAFATVKYHLQLTLEELDIERSLIMIILGFVDGAEVQVVDFQAP